MEIANELSENKNILLVVPAAEYNDILLDNMKQLSGKKICYVTLNKTYDSLKEIFKKAKVKTEGIVFIDGISSTIKNMAPQTDGCYFVSSPSALTEIAILITKILRHNFDYLIFDSLSTLLVYQKNAPVARFAASIVNTANQANTKSIFYLIPSEEHKSLIDETGMFFSKVIDLSK